MSALTDSVSSSVSACQGRSLRVVPVSQCRNTGTNFPQSISPRPKRERNDLRCGPFRLFDLLVGVNSVGVESGRRIRLVDPVKLGPSRQPVRGDGDKPRPKLGIDPKRLVPVYLLLARASASMRCSSSSASFSGLGHPIFPGDPAGKKRDLSQKGPDIVNRFQLATLLKTINAPGH